MVTDCRGLLQCQACGSDPARPRASSDSGPRITRHIEDVNTVDHVLKSRFKGQRQTVSSISLKGWIRMPKSARSGPVRLCAIAYP